MVLDVEVFEVLDDLAAEPLTFSFCPTRSVDLELMPLSWQRRFTVVPLRRAIFSRVSPLRTRYQPLDEAVLPLPTLPPLRTLRNESEVSVSVWFIRLCVSQSMTFSGLMALPM